MVVQKSCLAEVQTRKKEENPLLYLSNTQVKGEEKIDSSAETQLEGTGGGGGEGKEDRIGA